MGTGTLLCRLHTRFAALGRYRLTIAPTFRPDAAYTAALRDSCSVIDRVVSPTDLDDVIAGLEPSDWVLFIDPTCVPGESVDPDQLLAHITEAPRSAVHLVSMETNVGGTCEWVDVDHHGDVTRVQRYYDDVTWSYASGVAASLVPVSCLRVARGVRFESLRALRSILAANGVPSRDVPLAGRTFDLLDERELLMLTERVIRGGGIGTASPTAHIGDGAFVDQSARLLGDVIVQAGAHVGANALIVGPAVVGTGARVGASAVLVQCIVQRGTTVPEAATYRHQLVSNSSPAAGSAERPSAYDPFSVRAFRADVQDGPAARPYAAIKFACESTLALAALIVLLPFLVLLAVLIKLDSPGPVFFADRRETKGGRNFRCLKFRTMVPGADAMQRDLMVNNSVDGPQFKMRKDPRLTRLGRWMRPCSIDELPQLVNVALGEMSLVGPRPSPFRENQTCVPWREGRLSVRPGITGLWQLCRHDREQGDFHQWIEYDLLYVKHMSPLLDIKIVLATIFTLGGKWSVPLQWMIPAAKPRASAC
jgi:lipopolysaccharide/colanic/teichoic acid biosynthesis glycosyltransferase